ncbi:MAG: thiaminase II, partial [Pseudomonadota bacterium]|nr:thiaminase II [Pseudomonadota bacterium]
MTFSQDVWQRNQDLYQKILALPFNQELTAGTLNREVFCHYVIQDAHY